MGDVVVNSYNLNNIEHNILVIDNKVDSLSNELRGVSSSVAQINNELNALKDQFEQMMKEQRMEAALQRATTELIRVRQEIESEFGNYRIVRDTMVGVLQATDAALVKKDTISRVTEELMLSTPKYWLAPCLVAVSAWIGNDKSLAERAIKEAVKRDRNKTAITMALICRRNKRTETCYEWLAMYFEGQDPRSINEGDFAYIDAYVNGVFGPDEKHVCDGYVEKWMREIKSNDASYEERQSEHWKQHCMQFTGSSVSIYPELNQYTREFRQIDSCVSRIKAVDTIKQRFDQINDAYVDLDELRNEIDKNLMSLIGKYDEDEMALRNEEAFYIAVKKHRGDEVAAQQEFNARTMQNERKVRNLIEQMNVIVQQESGIKTSQKKTAIKLISSDINRGIDKYITEGRNAFPNSITLDVNGFCAVEKDGSERDYIIQSYCTYQDNVKAERIKKAQETKTPMILWILAGILGVAGIAFSFAVLPLGIVMIIGAIVCAISGFASKKNIVNVVDNITKQHEEDKRNGVDIICRATDQWIAAQKVVAEFDSKNMRSVS